MGLIEFWKDPATKIYLTHFLASWGDRLWQFVIGVYLIILYDDSLLLTAIYGFSSAISIILLGAFIGKWVDRVKRINAVKTAIIIQNLAVAVCCIFLIGFIHFRTEIQAFWRYTPEVFMFMIIVLAVIADLASVASKIALEKDWIVVLAKNDEAKLAQMNVIMRSINLSTYILAPIVIGQLITYWSNIAGAGFAAAWNIISAFCEVYLLDYIYNKIPRLGQKLGEDSSESSGSTDNLPIQTGTGTRIKEAIAGWKNYLMIDVRNAGLALACLYMSVLGFDNITTGYLLGETLSPSFVSTVTAISAFFGILGSISFQILRSNLGKLRTGLFGFAFFALALLPCVISLFVQGSPFDPKVILDPSAWLGIGKLGNVNESIHTGPPIEFGLIGSLFTGEYLSEVLIISGMIIARFGLWISDLSVTQIFQEEIPEKHRGIINGVQDSLNQIMNLLKFLLVILLPRKETFGYLVMLTWLFVFIGFLLFASYAFTTTSAKRKHPNRNSGSFYRNSLFIDPGVPNSKESPQNEMEFINGHFYNVNLGFDSHEGGHLNQTDNTITTWL